MVKYTGRGLVVKRPGVLIKVQMLTLVFGVGVFSLLPIFEPLKVISPPPPKKTLKDYWGTSLGGRFGYALSSFAYLPFIISFIEILSGPK